MFLPLVWLLLQGHSGTLKWSLLCSILKWSVKGGDKPYNFDQLNPFFLEQVQICKR